MNPTQAFFRHAAAIVLTLAAFAPCVQAAPGAHGPDGEHLDAPGANATAGDTAPRFDASSEAFELVGRLSGGELSLMINRYETGEPVLQAKVEVESGSLKAAATFHADLGDYAVADQAFLNALSQPGEHPIVVTVLAGQEADLLDGTLLVSEADLAGDHGHDHGHGHDGGHVHHWWESRRVKLAALALSAAGIGMAVGVVIGPALRRRHGRAEGRP